MQSTSSGDAPNFAPNTHPLRLVASKGGVDIRKFSSLREELRIANRAVTELSVFAATVVALLFDTEKLTTTPPLSEALDALQIKVLAVDIASAMIEQPTKGLRFHSDEANWKSARGGFELQYDPKGGYALLDA